MSLLTTDIGKKQRSEGQERGRNVDTQSQCELFLPFVSTFMYSLGTFRMERLLFFFFFLMCNVCSKYFRALFSPPPCQGDALCIASSQMSPFASLPYQAGAHKFPMCLRLLSPHKQPQTQRPALSPPGQGHFRPAHPQNTESGTFNIQ